MSLKAEQLVPDLAREFPHTVPASQWRQPVTTPTGEQTGVTAIVTREKSITYGQAQHKESNDYLLIRNSTGKLTEQLTQSRHVVTIGKLMVEHQMNPAEGTQSVRLSDGSTTITAAFDRTGKLTLEEWSQTRGTKALTPSQLPDRLKHLESITPEFLRTLRQSMQSPAAGAARAQETTPTLLPLDPLPATTPGDVVTVMTDGKRAIVATLSQPGSLYTKEGKIGNNVPMPREFRADSFHAGSNHRELLSDPALKNSLPPETLKQIANIMKNNVSVCIDHVDALPSSPAPGTKKPPAAGRTTP